jgi:mycofactocin precursor
MDGDVTTTVTSIGTTEAEVTAESVDETVIVSDLLVEDVSIDGMCGVY